MTTLNEFYNFNHTPLTKSVATRDLFPSRGHCEIQGRLAFALQDRLPALITGDVGTGKSTALRAFAHSLDRNVYAVVYLANPHLGVSALYREILLALQVEPAFGFMRLLPQLRNTLTSLARKGRYVLLIADEAHLLPPEIFDQLRFLLNDKMDSASLISLVLLGQPDLANQLRFAPYEALHQRIAVRYHLKPFDLEETVGYIKHQLKVIGFQGQIFSDSFLAAVHDHTKGVARQINNVCRSALLLGVTEKKQILRASFFSPLTAFNSANPCSKNSAANRTARGRPVSSSRIRCTAGISVSIPERGLVFLGEEEIRTPLSRLVSPTLRFHMRVLVVGRRP